MFVLICCLSSQSVFGGLKNFLSKSKTEPLASPSTSSKPEPTVGDSGTKKELQEAINKAKNSETGYNHPGMLSTIYSHAKQQGHV